MTLPELSSIPTAKAALGCDESHIVNYCDLAMIVHCGLLEPWQTLQQAASDAGFSITIASGYRSFSQQQKIWNRKFLGLRPVLDRHGVAMNMGPLSALEKVCAIMRWSALPGASRHHWGTDIDIYDCAAIDADYQLKLIPEEYRDNGPFAPMTSWLTDYLSRTESPDFFFPYASDEGGIAPEPWHLSYRPLALQFEKVWTKDHYIKQLQLSDIQGKRAILDHFDPLYERFVDKSLHAISAESTTL